MNRIEKIGLTLAYAYWLVIVAVVMVWMAA